MWKQTKVPNLDPIIYQGGKILLNWLGYCLAYIQTAFGAGWAGATAWESWTTHTKGKHADDKLPKGVYVPIWFSHTGTYGGVRKNWGHVAIIYIYPNGTCKIWSSPISNKPYADTFTSIAAVERAYGAKYVGWSEYVGGTRVIEKVATVSNITRAQLDALFAEILERKADQSAIDYYVGKFTYDYVRNDMLKSPERQKLLAKKEADRKKADEAAIKAEAARIAAEEAKKAAEKKRLEEEAAKAKAEADRLAEEERKKKEEQAINVPKWDDLVNEQKKTNGLLTWIVDLLKAIFNRG